MSNKFYLTLSSDGIENLKNTLLNAQEIESLEIESLTEEIVECLIAAKKPIGALILEDEFIDGTLLTKLLTSIKVEDLVFPGSDACEAECCGECGCEEEDEE